MKYEKSISTVDFSKVVVTDISDIDTSDYPDFCDAYISGATIDGEEVTEEQLEEINNDTQFVYDSVIKWIF